MSTSPTPSTFRTQLADRRRKQLSDAIAELRLLPTTVSVPMKILQLQRDPAATVADFGTALLADPSLTTKVLALANSASCAPARPVTKITEAITRIGLKNLLALVFGLSIGGIFNKMGMPALEKQGPVARLAPQGRRRPRAGDPARPRARRRSLRLRAAPGRRTSDHLLHRPLRLARDRGHP